MPDELEVRLCDHPRATRQIEVARSVAGLAAFALAALLSLRAGLPAFDAVLRALIAGVVGYVAVWALTVAVWRHLAVAELETARRAAAERRGAARGDRLPEEAR